MSERILIVDDNPQNLIALEAQLECLEHVSVVKASGADEALALLTEGIFCLAIVDVQMSPISGFELARLIRGVRKFRELPIIFLTAHSRSEQFNLDSYEAGGVDILYKPVQNEIILSKVKIFLQMHQSKRELMARLEKEESLRHKVEAANKSVSLMLANVSHELRTPLGNISGFAELLTMSESLSKEHLYLAEKVLKNARELKSIIDDVLDVSRMEAGNISIDETEFSLRELLRDIDETLSLRANKNGVRFILNIADPLPAKISGDPVRIKQVLNNVLGNSLKFTDTGSVKLTVNFLDDILTCRIEDTGIGISAHQQPFLFKPFKQANRGISSRYGGNGLGLALSKDICEKLGGTLKLESSLPDIGSVFVATFAVRAVAGEQAGANLALHNTLQAEVDHASLKALFIDDIEDNRVVTHALLSHIGVSLDTAGSGKEGLVMAGCQDYDFILLDIQMPEMDGYEVFSRLRRMGYEKPIIALSANAMKESVEKCLAMGFNNFLSKPVSLEQVTSVLKQSVL